MKCNLKEFFALNEEDSKLLLKEQKGEITEEECAIKSDEILDKIISFENVHSYSSFEEYALGWIDNMARRYSEVEWSFDQKCSDWVFEKASHEREHALVSVEYDLNPTYCFMNDETSIPGFWHPFNYVRSMDIFKKGWDDYTRFRYHIKSATAPKELSSGDKSFLKILEERVRKDIRLNRGQRSELLELVLNGLNK